MGYLRSNTIASHAATLVAVLVALLSKETLSEPEVLGIWLIGMALPIMVLGFVLAPDQSFRDPTAEKFYLCVYPVAHLAGIAALTAVLGSVSVPASNTFVITSVVCLGVLILCHRRIMKRPAVKEAYERAKEAKCNKASN